MLNPYMSFKIKYTIKVYRGILISSCTGVVKTSSKLLLCLLEVLFFLEVLFSVAPEVLPVMLLVSLFIPH